MGIFKVEVSLMFNFFQTKMSHVPGAKTLLSTVFTSAFAIVEFPSVIFLYQA